MVPASAVDERSRLSQSSADSRPPVLGFIALALLSIAVYVTTPLNYWVADDYNYVGPKDIDRVISFFDPTLRAFYRPLNWTTWAIDYALWGESSFGWHLTSILIATVTCLIIALLVYRLFANWTIALLAGAFFAVHPTHPETVTFIGGRADEVCGLFYFASVLFFVIYLQHRAEGRSSWLSGTLAFLMAVGALMSKEAWVTLPFALLLTDIFFFTPPSKLRDVAYWRGRVLIHLPFITLVAGYALMRYYLVASGTITNPYAGLGMLSWQGLLDAAAGNILLAVGVWGGPLIVEDMSNLVKVGLLLVALAASILAVRYVGRAALYCLLWFALTLAPTANLSAPRWVYIPSFGICLLAALVILKLAGSIAASEAIRRRAAYGLAGVLILVWGSGVFYQNILWYRSGEEAKSILTQIQTLLPDPPKPTTIYFARAPYYYDTALLFNTGLPAAMSLIYKGQQVNLHEVEQPLPDKVIVDALSQPSKLGPNPVFLGYTDGEVVRYPSLEALVQAGIGK